MTLTTDDYTAIRSACYHLAKCRDSLKTVEHAHPISEIGQADIFELALLPDPWILTEEQIREALQDLQEDK